nr:FAD-dependent monooxygenase [Micrococcus terreus]
MTSSVVIVGGGPAGMVLGLLLARAGITVTVLEKHTDFLRDFRGDTVHPSTMTLLDDLGLFNEFDALSQSRLEGMDLTLAVQDAVATARLLAPALRQGEVRVQDLARVRRRRLIPTVAAQGLQRILHARLIVQVLSGKLAEAPQPLVALLRRVPALASIPGYLVGVGLLSERAPHWARRGPVSGGVRASPSRACRPRSACPRSRRSPAGAG